MSDRRPTPLLRFAVTELPDADEPSFDLRAEFGGRAIAHSRAALIHDTLFVEHLVVDENARNQGVGTEVLRQLQREATRRGLRFLRCTLWRGRRDLDVVKATGWLGRRGFAVTLADGGVIHCTGEMVRGQ